MIPYEWRVALRFLRFDRNQTLFILGAIAVGVSVQIFLDSLITSLQANLVNETIGRAAHITAVGRPTAARPEPLDTPKGTVSADFTADGEPVAEWLTLESALAGEPELINLVPVLETPGTLERGGLRRSVLLRGLRPQPAEALYQLSEGLLAGAATVSGREVLLGAGLAADFDLGVGDSARLVLPGLGEGFWTVAGIVDFGGAPLNDSWVLADLGAVQSALGSPDSITRFEAQVRDVYGAQALSERLARRYGTLRFTSWQEANAQLLSALRSQSSSSATIQVFVLLSILMGISSVLGISVAQKNREIGILKAMGATSFSTRSIFLIQGLVLGGIGAGAGTLGGWLLIQAFARFAPALSFTIALTPGILPRMLLITTAAGVISAWIPSNRSAALNPIEVIRNG